MIGICTDSVSEESLNAPADTVSVISEADYTAVINDVYDAWLVHVISVAFLTTKRESTSRQQDW